MPVIVTVAGPVVAVELAVKTRVLELTVVGGLNVADTPAGRPEAVKVTLPLKPLMGENPTVVLAVPPWLTDTLEGETASEKSGGAGFTVKLMVVV